MAMYRSAEILLIEDNPGDVRLTQEALKENKIRHNLSVAKDGVEAIKFLRKLPGYESSSRPDIILLDLNLPKKDGREVLSEIKSDVSLRSIPVVILTTSDAEDDVAKAYHMHANCYVRKPIDLNRFIDVVKVIENFWLSTVELPPTP
ncbi:MAG: response regulator [Kiritimatiellaceae bacterium]|nr:response regulator [Kiritimatiellaceae bacterium]